MSEQITARYFRSVIAHPKGAVVHHADCRVFGTWICTCGLLHDLISTPNPDVLYAKFYSELALHQGAIEFMAGHRRKLEHRDGPVEIRRG